MNTHQLQKNNIHIKVLFITESSWCYERPEVGVSEWNNNLVLSLKETGFAEVEPFYFDKYFREHQKRGDEALLQRIKDWKPDLICLDTNKMPGTCRGAPELSTLSQIKNLYKIPVVAIFGDLESPELEEISKIVAPFTELIIATASDAVVKRIKSMVDTPEKYVYMWVPKRPSVFNDPGKERDIEVSYVGSPRGIRLERVNALKKENVSVFCGGGEGAENLTVDQYVDKYQHSKIALSFSRAVFSHVINARPFEAIACGAMLMEQEGSETPKLFIPYVDYVPFTSNKDLVEKTKYYLGHEDERNMIAKNGWTKVATQYSSERFWKFIIEKTLHIGKPETPAFILSWSDLSHMPKWRAAKLIFLDMMCETRRGFAVYFSIVSRTNKVWLYRQLQRSRICITLYKYIRRQKNIKQESSLFDHP